MVRKLEAAPVTLTAGTPDAYRALRDGAMHSLGIGTTHDMKSVITGLFLPSWACPHILNAKLYVARQIPRWHQHRMETMLLKWIYPNRRQPLTFQSISLKEYTITLARTRRRNHTLSICKPQ